MFAFVLGGFLGLSLIPLICLVVFVILLTFCVAFDDISSNQGFNWAALAVVSVGAAIYYWQTPTLPQIRELVGLSVEYLGCGVLFFLGKFVYTAYMQGKNTKDEFAAFKMDPGMEISKVESFLRERAWRSQNSLIKFVANQAGTNIEPEVQKAKLAFYMSSWICYWWAHAISLIFTDLFRNFFRLLAEIFHKTLDKTAKALY